MNMGATGYWLAGLTALIGIVGQWSADLDAELWRAPAAALILGLGLEFSLVRSRPLQLERCLPDSGLLGRPLELVWRLRNPGSHRIDLELAEDFPTGLSASPDPMLLRCEPGAEQSLTLQLVPTALGTWRWRRLTVRVRGLFGLGWWTRRLDQPAALRVLPDRLGRPGRQGSATGLGERHRQREGGGSELLYLRDYQPGDPLRGIDWKASARSGGTKVRVFSRDEHLELLLLLDCGRTSHIQAGELTRLHHRVNLAARLAEQASELGDRIGLIAFADRPDAGLGGLHGASGLRRLRDRLAELRSLERESNPLTAAIQARRVARQRSLIVLLTDVDDGEAADQLMRATALLTPKHLPIVTGLLDTDTLTQRWRTPNHWLDPYRNLAALELHRAALVTRARLERAGAHVLLTTPRAMDAALLDNYRRIRANRLV